MYDRNENNEFMEDQNRIVICLVYPPAQTWMSPQSINYDRTWNIIICASAGHIFTGENQQKYSQHSTTTLNIHWLSDQTAVGLYIYR